MCTLTGLLAGAVAVPELALADGEAEAIAMHGHALLEHYGVGGLSETTQLWFNFAMVGGAIAYGHYGKYSERQHHEKLVAAAV